jgi:hypothetical protein
MADVGGMSVGELLGRVLAAAGPGREGTPR